MPAGIQVKAEQWNAEVTDANLFWQGVPLGSSQKATITFADLPANKQNISLRPQSNGVWGNDTVEVLYDAANGRIQVWIYDARQGWVQYGRDVPVKFVAGDRFSVQAFADGIVQIHRNGKLLATRDVIP